MLDLFERIGAQLRWIHGQDNSQEIQPPPHWKFYVFFSFSFLK